MPSFTDLSLKNLPIPEKGQITVKDGSSPLSVRVSQGGSKTFFVTLDGSGTRHIIGRYGEVTLAQAREAAKRLRAEKTLGRILPSVVNLDQARAEYLAGLDIRSNTKIYYERNLARLKGTKLQDITPRDINKILDGLGQTSRIQALRSYSAFFNWCLRRHYLDTSPVARMEAGTSQSRARVLSDEELVKIWKACAEVQHREGALLNGETFKLPSLPTSFAIIVRLLILTGQRRGEITALKAEYFNEISQHSSRNLTNHSPVLLSKSAPSGDLSLTCTLPAILTKNKREHTFPIGNLGLFVLQQESTNTQTGYLFPARGTQAGKPFNGFSKSKAALDKLSGLENWTLHDLRRTYATNMAKLGVPIHIIEKLLNHVSGSFGGIVSVYNRNQYMPEMIEAVAKYENWLSSLVGQT